MGTITKFPDANLQSLCEILGDTQTGLTGAEIGRFLRECRIADPIPDMTKRHRLYAALRAKQESDNCGNNVVGFILHVMNPVRHVDAPDYFEREREKVNRVLAFSGLSLGEDGHVRAAATARTLGEAEQRAGILRRALSERKVHPDVIRFCRAELVADNYFHAVFEATKSVAEKIRQLSGLTSDGAALVDEAFGTGKALHPRLAFNSLTTESERSEHTGLMNLMKGLFGAFRNTTGHAPRIHWAVSEQDALDILTTLSLVHRRLDGAVRTHVP